MNLSSLQKTTYSFEFSNWARTAMVGCRFAGSCGSAGLCGAEGVLFGEMGVKDKGVFMRIQV